MTDATIIPRMGRKRRPQTKAIASTTAGKFGARLAYLADSRGITAVELGKKIGKTPEMVRKYYAGKSVPHINDWPRIARALSLRHPRQLFPD